jgi:hypothetical protein
MVIEELVLDCSLASSNNVLRIINTERVGLGRISKGLDFMSTDLSFSFNSSTDVLG